MATHESSGTIRRACIPADNVSLLHYARVWERLSSSPPVSVPFYTHSTGGKSGSSSKRCCHTVHTRSLDERSVCEDQRASRRRTKISGTIRSPRRIIADASYDNSKRHRSLGRPPIAGLGSGAETRGAARDTSESGDREPMRLSAFGSRDWGSKAVRETLRALRGVRHGQQRMTEEYSVWREGWPSQHGPDDLEREATMSIGTK